MPPPPPPRLLPRVALAVGAALAVAALAAVLVTSKRAAREVQDFADCDSPECRGEWAVARWEEAPDAVAARIAEVEDPVVRMAIVERLVEAHPQTAGRLCRDLPPGPVADRCHTVTARQHLWGKELDPDVAGANISPEADAEVARLSPWASRAPVRARCDEGLPTNTCQWDAARRAIEEGRSHEVGALCLGMEGEKWQTECFFQLSERTFFGPGPDRVADAVDLCLGAGRWFQRCLLTLTASTVATVPSAAWDEPAAWRRFDRSTVALHDALARHDPDLARELTEGVWSVALLQAYRHVAVVGGNPLRGAGPTAAPFVRAAAAWRLLQVEATADRDLDAWTTRLEEALAADVADPLAPPPEPLDWELIPDRATLPPVPEDLPALPYRGGVTRTVSADPRIDLRLCLVEAARELGGVHLPLLREAALDPDPQVRWSAVRALRAWGYQVDDAGRVLAEPVGASTPASVVAPPQGVLPEG